MGAMRRAILPAMMMGLLGTSALQRGMKAGHMETALVAWERMDAGDAGEGGGDLVRASEVRGGFLEGDAGGGAGGWEGRRRGNGWCVRHRCGRIW